MRGPLHWKAVCYVDLMRTSLAALCAAILFGPGLYGQTLSGRRAPSFSLPDSKLVQHDILDYRGRWLIIDFMKTSCPHCKALSKTLEQVKAKYGPKIDMLSIVIPPENTATVGQYILENKVTFPIVFDSSQVAIAYFKASPERPGFDTPHWFAIDPNGMIAKDWGQWALDNGDAWVKELDQLIVRKK
jgi:peroxiredoxin